MENIAKTNKDIGDTTGGVFGATLLIAGTTIGAGMLAVPIVTGNAGFYPGLCVITVCYVVMLLTGLLFLEATLLMPDGSNLLSICKEYLGRKGEILGGGTFLFLYYCLMVAYLSAGGNLFTHFLEQLSGLSYPTVSLSLFTVSFGTIIFAGSHIVDRSNVMLMLGLVVSYAGLLAFGSSIVDTENFSYYGWGYSLLAAPTLFSAFGFHNIVPTMATYLHRDRRNLRRAIIMGTTIPLVVYIFWQWLILGAISPEQLTTLGNQGAPIGKILQQVTGNPWIIGFANFFSFFALVTSILGVSLSMVDFLGDGLGWNRTGLSRLSLVALVFVPPFLVAKINPSLFVKTLGIAGGFGEALINCLIPIALVWAARYHFHQDSEQQVKGGRPVLVLLAGVTIFIMLIESYDLLR